MEHYHGMPMQREFGKRCNELLFAIGNALDGQGHCPGIAGLWHGVIYKKIPRIYIIEDKCSLQLGFILQLS